MGRFKNIPYRKIKKLLEINGWHIDRQRGSHILFVKPGTIRPVVIPYHEKEIDSYLIREVIKALNISEEEFIEKIKKI